MQNVEDTSPAEAGNAADTRYGTGVASVVGHRRRRLSGRTGLLAALLAVSLLSSGRLGSAAAAGAAGSTCNAHYVNSLTFPIPGRGLALSWAPPNSGVAGGHAIAVGGHLVGSQTFLKSGERYDTKLFDTSTGAYIKRFGVHYWWAVSNAWTVNPYLGEVIADGAGDHAAKVFDANGPGTNLGTIQGANLRGRYAVEDGALAGIIAVYGRNSPGLGAINAWITALAFSPDGDYLAGASKDGSIRIWQITNAMYPEDQFRVVKVYYDPSTGAALSVRWSPDGTMLAAGFKSGQAAAIYSFDPVTTRWSESTIAAFARVSFDAELGWLNGNIPLVADAPVWRRTQPGAVWNVRFSPDGVYLAVAGDRSSSVFDLSTTGETGYPLLTEGHGLDFSPDGQYLAVGGGDGLVSVFARTSSAPPYTLYDVLQGHTEDVVSAVAWSPDGSTLASVAGGPLLGNATFNNSIEGDDDHVRLWARAESDGVACAGGPTPTTTTPSTSSTTTPKASTTTTSTTPKPSTTTTSTTTPKSSTTTTIPGNQGAGYPGFGYATTGGKGYPTVTVTNSTDSGAGSLRDALARAQAAGGGNIRFNVSDSGDMHPRPNLIVPPNTTIDATGSHITLWGGNEGGKNGVLNLWNSNVIVIGLRVRNALNDGIQVEPRAQDISDIVIDRCSVTGSADGGIDVSGHSGQTINGITIMRTFVAGSGTPCKKAPCGGGSLLTDGAFSGSYYANFFLSNLEGTPLINGSSGPVPVVADLRYNLVEATQSSAMSVRNGASANVVGNFFVGAQDGARLWPPAQAYFGGGNTDQNTGSSAADHLSAALGVPAPPDSFSLEDAQGAGAVPRDAIDTCYVNLPKPSFATFRAAACAGAITN
jgi:WD40 repeat protein